MASVDKFLVPKSGVRIMCPERMQPLAPAGEIKRLSSYWHKRIHEGDVTAYDSQQAYQDALAKQEAQASKKATKTASRKRTS